MHEMMSNIWKEGSEDIISTITENGRIDPPNPDRLDNNDPLYPSAHY